MLENIPGYNRDLQGSLEDDGFKTDNREKKDAYTSILSTVDSLFSWIPILVDYRKFHVLGYSISWFC